MIAEMSQWKLTQIKSTGAREPTLGEATLPLPSRKIAPSRGGAWAGRLTLVPDLREIAPSRRGRVAVDGALGLVPRTSALFTRPAAIRIVILRMSAGCRTMKLRETAVRRKRFEANEMARKVAELEHTIREFEGMANDLARQVKADEERTRVKDPAHFAYSTFARSASQRRDNLRASVSGLMAKLEEAQRERDEALEQLARGEYGPGVSLERMTSEKRLNNTRSFGSI